MARYTAGVRTTATAIGPMFDIRTAATDRIFVLEIGIFSTAATAITAGVIRPLTTGTTSTTTAGQAEDPANPAGTGLIGTAWSVTPTIAATPIYLRRFVTPAAIGNGIIWTFGGVGLVVPASSSLLVWNIAIGPVCDIYVAWDE